MEKSLLVLFMLLSFGAAAGQLLPPENPEQTLAYWKPYLLSADSTPSVQQAHHIFENLLKTWGGTRVEPVLHVVKTGSGPWAASLLDGTILLSQSAIEVCQSIGGESAEHLLAFVLAHELAHQRTDDLWHFKFFRLVGAQKQQIHSSLLDGFELDQKKFLQIEKQETQADQDGLILMTMVGYDPHEVVTKNNFFQAWVENIWKKPCKVLSEQPKNNRPVPFSISSACEKAEIRANRAKAHLEKIMNESALYQLGIESFVAGNYQQARKYFKSYGRIYPGHVIHNSIGVTYLSEVIEVDKKLAEYVKHKRLGFQYPMIIDLNPVSMVKTRGKAGAVNKGLSLYRNKILSSAIDVFEKAVKLAPGYKPAYLNLISAYLLKSNTPMAEGILLGKYKDKFGTDIEYDLLQAMSKAIKDSASAEKYFNNLSERILKSTDSFSNTQIYMVMKNAALYWKYIAKDDRVKRDWKRLAMKVKNRKNPSLFRLALAELQPDKDDRIVNRSMLWEIRDKVAGLLQQKKEINKNRFIWYQGEKLYLHENKQGDRFIVTENNIFLSSSMKLNSSIPLTKLSEGDTLARSFLRLGVPDRHIYLPNGEYITYDEAGVALYVKENKLNSWFVY